MILCERGSYVGLTTAAAIFGEAAIGMAAGGGFYAVSGLGFLIILFALVILIYVENLFNLKPGYMLVRISTYSADDLVHLLHHISSQLVISWQFQVSMTGEKTSSNLMPTRQCPTAGEHFQLDDAAWRTSGNAASRKAERMSRLRW